MALVRIPPPLSALVSAAFGRVWGGVLRHTEQLAPGEQIVLAIVAHHRIDEALAMAQELERNHPEVPVMVMVRQARQVRSARVFPPNVAWCLWTDELEPARLALAMRYALEFGQRRRLERRLEQVRGLADVGSVAGAVAHEIGNPLTSLLTNLEFARGEVSEAIHGSEPTDLKAVLDALKDAHDGARHVSRIAGDLGRASRRSGRVAAIDARSVLETSIRLASEPLSRVSILRHYRRIPPVRADESRLCQVLLNLLKNAAEALHDTAAAQVRVEVEESGRFVVISVRDNGPGVPEDAVDRLFEPYFTTRATGTGLGLPLSRRFIEEMGGRLEVAAHGSGGAAFRVYLRATSQSQPPAPTLVPDRQVGRQHVLVVDDARLIRRAFYRALTPDHVVTLADDAHHALRVLEAGASFDMVFVDLHMPGLTGIDFFEQMARHHPNAVQHTVFLSGAFSQQDLAWLDQRGLPWVRKPIGAQQLRDLVSDLLVKKGLG